MNTVLSRRKRDSVPNLYAKCKLGGDCLPDVQNKVEANTLADKLLKWLGSVIYLGGLGIGTGRGSGGSTGYTPLGSPSRVIPGGTVVRPTVPIDPVGPVDILPIDAVDPAGSSIIPLEDLSVVDDLTTNTNIITPELTTPDLDILVDPDPVSDVSGTSSHPTVIGGEDNNVAVLDVTPTEPPPKRIALGASPKISTPHISVISDATSIGHSADINVFVDDSFAGITVGNYEEIPLQDFNVRAEFEIEAGPKSSTPRDIIDKTIGRARQLYGRRVQQVATRNLDFLGQASRAVVFGFENPAFDPDITMTFQQDLAEVAAAPDADFTDVITLGRPQYSETESGLLRVSRFGQRGTIRTRSGVQIGQAVHFYYDLSTIDTSDALEMTTLGQHSADLSIVDAMADSSFINPFENPDPTLNEEQQLLDRYTESFENSHLLLTGSRRNQSFTIPTLPPGIALRVFVDDIGQDLFVSYPETTLIPASGIPIEPFEPFIPSTLQFDTFDYDIHPSAIKKRRKRKRSDFM